MTHKFRKKPVEIEAFQLTKQRVEAHILDKEPLPFGLRITSCTYHPGRGEVQFWRLPIATLEGTMNAVEDDWIIKGVKDELYPCKPDIFAATYDAVDGK